ncbi:ParB/RepB/Spo0J family partition protein [Streptomyces beijiangensis]|uniref:ParB/RepB/Spo0J family partition protein n=1 Tax=Streptomyces beijiangensis TaxID=163361 RepID=A0A939JHR9_9ACTN|nr:ParB/RepB/Spo0J family partition protein [Streptomyces beijiangensis]MBO0512405.1 ParB/RepB/Spo0J family partition protein [Streptomyces beijiangensis]
MIKTLKMAHIVRNENQPREHFDEAKLQELVDSIAIYGQMQPIEVRKLGVNRYEIVAGERRVRAHQILGAITIQASVIVETDDLKAFKRSVSENVTRADMLPLEEARAFARILDDEEGATPATVAKDFGKTVPYINQRLALLNLTAEIAEQVNTGAIGTQAAVKLAELTPGNQREVLAKWARGDFAGDNALVHFAYALRQQQNQEVCMIVEDMTPEEREERAVAQTRTRNTLDGIERIRGLLDQIVKADPAALSFALEGEVGARLEQMDRVAEAVQQARFNLRQAKAHAEAHEIIVNEQATAS